MILTDYFYPVPDITWTYARQCGVTHGVIRLPETGDFDLTDRTHWRTLCDRFRSDGLTPLVVEPLPNELHDHIKSGDEKREQSIEAFLKMLPIMRDEGLTTVCFNWMCHTGWTRTSSVFPERGGALSTAFDLADYKPVKAAISEEKLWDNYRIFVDAAVPEAEKYGIRLALHPDDPPLPRLGNVSRIMISYPNIRKAIDLHPSENLGVTFCQACYQVMGEDPEACARAFGQKIFFVHFRNTTGTPSCFHETFHDNGDIRMGRMIEIYQKELKLDDIPIRVDHVPLMGNTEEASDSTRPAGYSALGRLYAIGYLKGLLEMCR